MCIRDRSAIKALEWSLRAQGMDNLLSCLDGAQALETIGKQEIELLLLDLNMPRKDGRTELREIKASPVLQRIPIVILTTSKAEEDIVRTYNLGVNSFICKPVTFDSLVEIVKTVGRYWIEIVALPPECQRAVA